MNWKWFSFLWNFLRIKFFALHNTILNDRSILFYLLIDMKRHDIETNILNNIIYIFFFYGQEVNIKTSLSLKCHIWSIVLFNPRHLAKVRNAVRQHSNGNAQSQERKLVRERMSSKMLVFRVWEKQRERERTKREESAARRSINPFAIIAARSLYLRN